MEKLDGRSMDIVEQNIEQLKELFPEVFSEGKIKFDQLQEVLGNYVVDNEDHYNFKWHGKHKAGRFAQTPTTGTLRPAKDESVDWDTTQNLFIEGDNLEVLKLLQKSYHRQVKMIYIDPPYNTGKEFIYPDNFQDNLDTYLRYTGQIDKNGYKFSTNSDTSGRYHTNWLNMMYPRLKLARNLLRDDGVIFISIDDHEVGNLRKIADEIFGEENFVATLAVQLNPRGRHLDKFIAKTHESIIIYAKDINVETTIYGLEKPRRMIEEYNEKDERGKYRKLGLRNRNQAFNPQTRPNLFYPLYVNPKTSEASTNKTDQFSEEIWPITSDGVKTCWTWGKKKVEKDAGLIIAGKFGEEWRVYRKDYLLDENGNPATTLPKSLWIDKEINNDYGKKSIKDLFGGPIMDFPKSLELIKKLIKIGTSEEDIVLDFFAGSATTAHAALQLNAEENTNRTFIMIQLPEPANERSPAYKAGYKTIADLGKDRIRRAINAIDEQQGELLDNQNDLGFKVFKLDSSNIKRWDANFDTLENDLLNAVDYIKQDRSNEDLLYELLLKYGLDLTVPIEERKIAGKAVYSIGQGALIACLDEDVSMDVVKGIGALKEELNPKIMRVVFKDDGFKDDVVKTNAIQELKRFDIQDIKSL